jgi:hypothetical protein
MDNKMLVFHPGNDQSGCGRVLPRRPQVTKQMPEGEMAFAG